MKVVPLTPEETRTSIEAIIEVIRDVLVPEQPQVVMGVLAELTARFIACHAPHIRSALRTELNDQINRMVPLVVQAMIDQDQASEAWKEPTRQ